ncbi:MAG: molybdate ABC transporter substrate-binding protein [Actinomycetota bacterium]
MRRCSLVLLCVVFTTAACSSSSSSTKSGGGDPAVTTITVFAASSLTGGFTRIGKDFEAAHPGTTVSLNLGPSDGLAGQIESEGTADVFASASATWMDDVREKVGVSEETQFATNQLVIITPPDNPSNIGSIDDLAGDGVQLVLAAPGVPVGDYAREALKSAGIASAAEANVVSNEQDDAALVAKIAGDEADAAIVYLSDVTSTVAPTVKSIPIPKADNVIAVYPIAVVQGGDASGGARFIDYVAGPEGQATLKTFGFLPPPATP